MKRKRELTDDELVAKYYLGVLPPEEDKPAPPLPAAVRRENRQLNQVDAVIHQHPPSIKPKKF